MCLPHFRPLVYEKAGVGLVVHLLHGELVLDALADGELACRKTHQHLHRPDGGLLRAVMAGASLEIIDASRPCLGVRLIIAVQEHPDEA